MGGEDVRTTSACNGNETNNDIEFIHNLFEHKQGLLMPICNAEHLDHTPLEVREASD